MKPSANQMLWRCRRGLLELDLVLRQFVERGYEALDEDQAALLSQLLEQPDNDLWDLISGRSQPESTEASHLLAMMRRQCSQPEHTMQDRS